MKILLNCGVTFGASIQKAGTEIDLPAEDARRLVEQGDAEYVNPADAGEGTAAPAGDGNENPAGDGNENPAGDGTAAPAADQAPIDLQKKALDAQYKRDDLAAEAKAAGVEFAFNAKKEEIIDAVIAQEKADALLK